jgi:hypothetical protein
MPQQGATRLRDTKCSGTRSGGRFRTAPVETVITRTPDAPNPVNPLTMSRLDAAFPRPG